VPETAFNIASLDKQFISAAILRLDRLRAGGDLLTIAALDAMAPLVALAAGAPLFVALGALVATHAVASLGVLRTRRYFFRALRIRSRRAFISASAPASFGS
jgi:hypothetical protein